MRTATGASKKHDALETWRDCVNRTLVNLDFINPASDFTGRYRCQSSGDCVVARLSGTAHRTTRSMRRLRETDNDFVLLVHLKQGSAAFTQGQFDGIVGEGDFLVIDGSRPHDLSMAGDFDHIALRLPRHRFHALHPGTRLLLERPAHGTGPDARGCASVMNMMASLHPSQCGTLSNLSAAAVSILGDLALGGDLFSGIDASRRAYLSARVLRYLDENFTDPDLSAARLAERVGVSRRYIDIILSQMHTTFGREILERRLTQARDMLGRPILNAVSITQIALDCGFNDMSHFSKRFRERYGCSPRQCRQQEDAHPSRPQD